MPGAAAQLRNECCPQGTVWNGRQCVPHTGPDLTINKEIDRCGLTECYYTIVVTNRGPGTYNGELIVGDVATAGQIITTSPDWTCTHANLPSGNDGVACRRPNTNIPPGQSVKLTVEVKVANGTTGGLLNCAIVDPRRDGNTSKISPASTSHPIRPAIQSLKSSRLRRRAERPCATMDSVRSGNANLPSR